MDDRELEAMLAQTAVTPELAKTLVDSEALEHIEPPRLLAIAIMYDTEHLALELLQRGIDPNTTVLRDYTALQLAAKLGKPKSLKCLLEQGADCEVTDKNRSESTAGERHITISGSHERTVKKDENVRTNGAVQLLVGGDQDLVVKAVQRHLVKGDGHRTLLG